MHKWFSKRTIQLVNRPPPSQPEDFSDLFVLVLKCFRQFGLSTVQVTAVKGQPKFVTSRGLVVLVAFVLVVTWAALVGSFFLQYNTAMITGIANHIQFITNVVALTAALVVPMFKVEELNEMLVDFCVIDAELNYFNVKLPHWQHKSSFMRCYVVHLLFLIITASFDGYVLLIMSKETPLWLWFFHLLPFALYSLAFMNAFTMIRWVKIRIQHVNMLIEQYQKFPLFDEVGRSKFRLTSVVMMNGVEESSINNRILMIVSRTIDLATRLESYNGLLFLFGYLALFCVTTIQVYYCYLHVFVGISGQGFSVYSFVLSLVIIVGNLVAILSIPYICEQVGNESKKLLSYLSKLSMRYGQSVQSSVWFPNLISSVKFSALGFFNINYNMLSSFFAALITYLIIFIQFNSIVTNDEKTGQATRSGKANLRPTEF
ncbi:hypothetical protein pipiens_001915 [Culex pipiens pipiens]|uniref:Gustatory receptor n=1 Tax=Culex pipiens pipiens TaxID=38569 RepID=A0ABD1DQ83_CULPP